MTHNPTGPTGNLEPFDWLEVIHPNVTLGRVRHALFDFDGTLSVIRRGWENVMIPLMVEMITDGHPVPPDLETEVIDYVDWSTGILTIKQMEWLADAVRRVGLASEPKTAREYKRIYNEQLLGPVRERLADLDGSQAARDTLSITGSRQFLEALRDRGVMLYLASGTDHIYVAEEAAALGVTAFFGRHIYGAKDDAVAMSKARLIQKIIEENDLHGEELLVIGDGPVEIRNGKAHDAVTLGVAADEDQRQGLNPRKRERVISAGADLVVTDFLHYAQLARLFTRSH